MKALAASYLFCTALPNGHRCTDGGSIARGIFRVWVGSKRPLPKCAELVEPPPVRQGHRNCYALIEHDHVEFTALSINEAGHPPARHMRLFELVRLGVRVVARVCKSLNDCFVERGIIQHLSNAEFLQKRANFFP